MNLDCTKKELDEFVINGFALKWEQFDISRNEARQ